jgi:hypothetical protein
MKLRLALEEKQLDLRVRDRLVTENKLTKEDLKKYLESLPDDTKNAVSLEHEDNSQLQ